MPRLFISVTVNQETLESYKELARMKACTMSKLLGEVLEDWVEMFGSAEMESEIEAQTGIEIPIHGFPPNSQLLS